MNGPAHYIVFHPEWARVRVLVRGTALVRGRLDESWEGEVWVDAPPGNKDPFVFGASWAYSYCHATQLRRKHGRGSYLREGSWLVFCSGDLAERDDVLAVDTIFVVAQAHEWPSDRRPPGRYAEEVRNNANLWKHHLQFGGQPGGHKGKYTYEAALYRPGDRSFSRLPLDDRGNRVHLPLRSIGTQLRDRVRAHLYMRRPISLAREEARAILDLVDTGTDTAVVRDIAPKDSAFLSLRAPDQDDLVEACSRRVAEQAEVGRGCR